MKQFVLPSNRTTPVPAGVPKTADVNLIPLDLAKYADTAERSRLLERWERGVLASPR
jgi:iron(III) transport system substrate-binding protein